MYSYNAYSEAAYSETFGGSAALSGAAAGVVTAAGNIQTGTEIAGTAAAIVTASGELSTSIQLSGAAIAQALASGGLLTGIPLEAAAQLIAEAVGSLTTTVLIDGAALIQALAAGGLDTSILLNGQASGRASAAGTIDVYRPLFGNASAIATAAGVVTEPAPPAKTFILGGLSIPFESHLDLNQDFEEEQASRITRHADGSARKQTAWRGKWRVRISGQGWYPPGLDMLDYENSLEMSCIALRAVTHTERIITIPAARRADQGFEPFAAVTVDGGKIDATITSIVGDVVTIAAVSNAQFYHVFYYPKIQVFAAQPTQRHDAINDKYSWEMEAREV